MLGGIELVVSEWLDWLLCLDGVWSRVSLFSENLICMFFVKVKLIR
jgi:hypothetical protein